MALDPIELARAAIRPRVRPVIDSLVDTVLCAELGREELSGERFVDETAAMLHHKLEHMPELFGLGMLGVTLAFDTTARARGGRPFRKQDLVDHQRCLDAWKRSPIGLLRSFTQFYEKMGTFVYYSHVEEADAPHGHEVR